MNAAADRAERPRDDGACIVCGPESELGLRLRFARDGDGGVRAELALPARFSGWSGIAHGGAVAMLLDEAMAYAALAAGKIAVTAEMTLRFRAAVPTETPLVVTGSIEHARKTALRTIARVADATGRELASARGTFVVRRDLSPGETIGSLDG